MMARHSRGQVGPLPLAFGFSSRAEEPRGEFRCGEREGPDGRREGKDEPLKFFFMRLTLLPDFHPDENRELSRRSFLQCELIDCTLTAAGEDLTI